MSSGALRGLLAAALADPFFRSLRDATGAITNTVTGPPAIRPFVASALASGFADSTGGVPVLLVTATGREAEAAAATIGELCRGQVLELQHLFDTTRGEDGYESTIEGKTAALFATSCRIGGMVASSLFTTLHRPKKREGKEEKKNSRRRRAETRARRRRQEEAHGHFFLLCL